MESEPLASVFKGSDGITYLMVGRWPCGEGVSKIEILGLEEGRDQINSAVESREKRLRDRIKELKKQVLLGQAIIDAQKRNLDKDLETVLRVGKERDALCAEVHRLESELSKAKDRERAAFERAKERAAVIADRWATIEQKFFGDGGPATEIRSIRFEDGK